MENGRMSTGERIELSRVVRLRAKIARQDVVSRVAELHAQVESLLAAEYAKYDPAWRELTMGVDRIIREADVEIARRCRARGIPENFRPGLRVNWYSRGENAWKQRRDELRGVAKSELEAMAEAGKAQILRSEAGLLEKIAAHGLSSDSAKMFLESMPTAEQLLPPLCLQDLEKKLPMLKAPEIDVDD